MLDYPLLTRTQSNSILCILGCECLINFVHFYEKFLWSKVENLSFARILSPFPSKHHLHSYSPAPKTQQKIQTKEPHWNQRKKLCKNKTFLLKICVPFESKDVKSWSEGAEQMLTIPLYWNNEFLYSKWSFYLQNQV
jgi:hypothetical protein